VGIVNLLLDTCTFLWLAQQPAMISVTASKLIDNTANELYLSQASVLEIVMKHSTGKLPLPDAPSKWVSSKLRYHQVVDFPLKQEVMFHSGELPRIHADPFDRLLAAHAIIEGFTLLSPDKPFSNLGASRIW
jgi:PIN domain nuclease of toxin-antitoxin system